MAAPHYSLLDRAIGWIAPATGLRRAMARNAMARVRAYEGASVKDGWIPRRGGASANADHIADARMLRHRARSLVQNNPYAAKALNCLVANIVGEGILPTSRAADDKTRANIDALWAEWSSVCDAYGGTDFNGLEAQAYRAMEQDGEVLVRLRARQASDGLPVPLQLQILEIDYLDSGKNGKGSEGGPIVEGIELDALGRVVAYWLFDTHPGDTLQLRTATQSRRYSADRILHLFAPDRPGQARGVTRFASVIARLRDLAIYEDAELARKQNEALMSVFVSGDGADFAVQGIGQSASDAAEQAALGNLGTIQPGAIMATNGQSVTIAEPKAAPGYADYLRMQLYAIAAGTGVTYEMLTGDLSQVNFSSARTGMLEFRRAAEQRQWHVLVPRLLTPVWVAFVNAAVLAGKIPRADYGVEWSTPKWDYVNPTQDVRADIDEVSGGLASLSEKLRKRGYNPEAVFAEMGQDYQRLKDTGALEMLRRLLTNGTSENPAPAPAPADPEEKRAAELHRRTIETLIARDASVGPNITIAPPDVRVENHLPAPVTHVAAAEVHVENNQPAPIVHVAAPEVRVENNQPAPIVHVAAPEVRVENTVLPAEVSVTLPARKTETTVIRDAKGNISSATQIETDLD